MASPEGTSSGSSSLQHNSGSEEDMQTHTVDERKRKRMQSNRESARRSRMRKQKHLDDLMVQLSDLRKTNSQVMNSINVTTQHLLKVEAENCVIRAQMSELSSRLQSLNEISNVMSANNHQLGAYEEADKMEELLTIPQPQGPFAAIDSFLMNPWSSTTSLNQPIMASANMFHY